MYGSGMMALLLIGSLAESHWFRGKSHSKKMKPNSTNELPPPSEPEVIPCFVSTEDLKELWERMLSW